MWTKAALLLPFILLVMSSGSIYGQKSFGMFTSDEVPTIRPDSLSHLMQSDRPFTLLDTRSPEEFRVSHIKGAIFINYNAFSKDDVKGLPKDHPVVVYCAVGKRSDEIGKKLLDMGFDKVANLYGGIFHWKNEGYEVVNPNGKHTERVHAYNRFWGLWLKKGEKVY